MRPGLVGTPSGWELRGCGPSPRDRLEALAVLWERWPSEFRSLHTRGATSEAARDAMDVEAWRWQARAFLDVLSWIGRAD